MWSREFLARHAPAGVTRVELRTGRPAERVLDLAGAEQAGLILLSWPQSLSRRRAALVGEVLVRSTLPVLLVPHTDRLAGLEPEAAPARVRTRTAAR